MNPLTDRVRPSSSMFDPLLYILYMWVNTMVECTAVTRGMESGDHHDRTKTDQLNCNWHVVSGFCVCSTLALITLVCEGVCVCVARMCVCVYVGGDTNVMVENKACVVSVVLFMEVLHCRLERLCGLQGESTVPSSSSSSLSSSIILLWVTFFGRITELNHRFCYTWVSYDIICENVKKKIHGGKKVWEKNIEKIATQPL